MKGKVKWFSEAKAHGYIVADDGKEHFMHIRDLKGADLPRNGDAVEFDSTEGKKGPKAVNVQITSRAKREQGIHAQASQSNNRGKDERVTCNSCKKKMIPRMIVYRGEPKKSVCPFCGATFKEFGGCFIATAVYGDYDAPEVLAFRRFRDARLQPSALGRVAIATYYKCSPPLARFVAERPRLAASIKPVFDALSRRLEQ